MARATGLPSNRRSARRISGGIVIGEACRPDLQPKQAGKAPLLRYDGNEGSGHVLVFAGSGGYKTTGTVVPSALEWRTGLVCLDPSAEALGLVFQARRAMGHRVVALNPEDPNADSFNVLDWIDVSTDRALLDLQAVVGWLCGESPGERYDDYFKHAARGLLGCLLADLVFDPAIQPERKTLLLLRRRVSRPIPESRKSSLEADSAPRVPAAMVSAFFLPSSLANLKVHRGKSSSQAGTARPVKPPRGLAILCSRLSGLRHQDFALATCSPASLDVFINLPLKACCNGPQAARVILGALNAGL